MVGLDLFPADFADLYRFFSDFRRFFNSIFVIPQESLQKFCEIYNLDSFGMTKFMIQNKTKNYGGKFQILLSKM